MFLEHEKFVVNNTWIVDPEEGYTIIIGKVKSNTYTFIILNSENISYFKDKNPRYSKAKILFRSLSF